MNHPSDIVGVVLAALLGSIGFFQDKAGHILQPGKFSPPGTGITIAGEWVMGTRR